MRTPPCPSAPRRLDPSEYDTPDVALILKSIDKNAKSQAQQHLGTPPTTTTAPVHGVEPR